MDSSTNKKPDNMDLNAWLYYQSALALQMPASLIESMAGFEVKLGKHYYFFRGGDTPFNCGSHEQMASNKYCMNKRLEAAGFPVPKATAIDIRQFQQDSLSALIEPLRFPLVIKPTTDSALGTGVLCNINHIDELKAHMDAGFKQYPILSIEEFHGHLNAYRVLVFYNRVIAVAQRFPASIIGDGVHSIRELIDITNQARQQLKGLVSYEPVMVDAEVHIRLKELGVTLDTIPKAQETVSLCYTCNDTRGGTIVSMGKKISKDNARLLCRAANVLGLNMVGFDVQCEDIGTPITASRGVIIEANVNPDIAMHEHPMSGIPQQVTKRIMRKLMVRHPMAYFWGLLSAKC